MIAYSTIGTNDIERARKFYAELFAELGVKEIFQRPDGKMIGFGTEMGAPMFLVGSPWNGEEASPGNGNMAAIAAKDPEQVKSLYEKAISLGATCEGEAGPRLGGMLHCGYVRDLDGNKLNFFCMGG